MKACCIFLLLFSFSALPAQELKPTDKLALVEGIATDFQKVPMKNELFVLVDKKTKKEIPIRTDANGKFRVLLPVNADYKLKYKSFTDEQDNTELNIPAGTRATYSVQVFIDPPKEFTLKEVLFDTGKSTLKPSSSKQLNELYEVLKLKSTMEVEIQGHTDNVGKAEDNLKLSEARARAVVDYLVKKGINPKRLSAVGYGDTRPVADNSTEEGRAKNRRTFLRVVKE